MHILCIDENRSAISELRFALKKVAGTVDQACTGQDGIKMVGLHDYDAVVLEMRLPDMNGLEVIQIMRAAKVTKPILVVGSNVRNVAKVRAFGLGADDFLAKPYDQDELVARLQAITRRVRSTGRPCLQVGPLRLDIAAQEAWVNGESLQLTGKELALLELLMVRKGSTLSKETILEQLYRGLDVPDIKIIDVFVCKLRKKLGQYGAADLIGTVWARGYGIRQPETTPRLIANDTRILAAEVA